MKEKELTEEMKHSIGGAIPGELYIASLLAMACDALLLDVQRRIDESGLRIHIDKDFKYRLNQYMTSIGRLSSQFEVFLSPHLIKMGAGNGFKNYEASRVSAQEIVRLLMLYLDRCRESGNSHKVFKFLEGIECEDAEFSIDDINRFDLGCRRLSE